MTYYVAQSGINMSFQVQVFWVVTPCSVEIEYIRFGGSCCLHLQGEALPRHWYPTATLHGVIP